MRALVSEGECIYRFWGGKDDIAGIKAFRGDDIVKIYPIGLKVDDQSGKITLSDYVSAVFDPDADVVIIIGNPNIRATWAMAVAARMLGKKVLFWAHGWLKAEPALKRIVRNAYFGLAHMVLVYNERAAELGVKAGFPRDKISVIYNSLDSDAALSAFLCAKNLDRCELRAQYGLEPSSRVLIYSGRLTELCQLDLLVTAVAKLNAGGGQYEIILVGDGDQADMIRKLAVSERVKVLFAGSVYDAKELAKLYRVSDLTVSPGKVGLTAIQSLSYAVPVLTHGHFDTQMPEVEAIIPGRTGSFFDRGSLPSLQLALTSWFSINRGPEQLEKDCLEVVNQKYNPHTQVVLLERAIQSLQR